LKPGSIESVVTYRPSEESDGRFKVAYTRLDWIESFADKARNSRNTIVQSVAKKLFPTAKLNWAQSDRITNSPPYGRISRYHITAPPPEIPTEVLQSWTRK
jgi:hypothetical protein